MAKYEVKEPFKDIYTNEVYTKGSEIEITVKRAKEIKSNLESLNRDFIKRIDKSK